MDVRPTIQYGICNFPNSVHIPIEELDKRIDEVKQAMTEKNVQDENGMCRKRYYFLIRVLLIK